MVLFMWIYLSLKGVIVFIKKVIFLPLTQLRNSLAVAYLGFILFEFLTTNIQQLCLRLCQVLERSYLSGYGFGSMPLRLHILTCTQHPHARFQKVIKFFIS